jgi:hypothetical protein
MHRKHVNSSQSIVWVLVLVAAAMVLAVGAADAQVIVENDEVRIELSGGQTARMFAGGDIFLGGNAWTGEIYLNTGGNLQVGSWIASTITLGNTGDDGDIFLRDSINNATTISMDGASGGITLGSSASTEDGDIQIHDNDGSVSIALDGASGNVSNQFGGNGLIKAWARINSNGTVASCWRCNTSASYTYSYTAGFYYVDFNFTTDITSRPLSAVIDSHSVGTIYHGNIQLGYKTGDASSVWVRTSSESGAAENKPFTLFVY